MKQYIQIEGRAFKLDGWTEKDADDFTDKLIELAEQFDSHLAGSVSRASEEELDIPWIEEDEGEG